MEMAFSGEGEACIIYWERIGHIMDQSHTLI